MESLPAHAGVGQDLVGGLGSDGDRRSGSLPFVRAASRKDEGSVKQ